MDDNDITQEISIEPQDVFDACIGRIRNMLAYGMTEAEIGEILLGEGFDLAGVFHTIQAAKLL